MTMKLVSEDSVKFVCGIPPKDIDALEQIKWLQKRYLSTAFQELSFRSACKLTEFNQADSSDKICRLLKITVKVELAENREEFFNN